VCVNALWWAQFVRLRAPISGSPSQPDEWQCATGNARLAMRDWQCATGRFPRLKQNRCAGPCASGLPARPLPLPPMARMLDGLAAPSETTCGQQDGGSKC